MPFIIFDHHFGLGGPQIGPKWLKNCRKHEKLAISCNIWPKHIFFFSTPTFFNQRSSFLALISFSEYWLPSNVTPGVPKLVQNCLYFAVNGENGLFPAILDRNTHFFSIPIFFNQRSSFLTLINFSEYWLPSNVTPGMPKLVQSGPYFAVNGENRLFSAIFGQNTHFFSIPTFFSQSIFLSLISFSEYWLLLNKKKTEYIVIV